MKRAYYDTAFLFKVQVPEAGSEAVQAHARTLDALCSAIHARAEFVSACHRKIREGHGSPAALRVILTQVDADVRAGGLQFLPITTDMLARIDAYYLEAPATESLRASDALHLACAAENGFAELFTNDARMLAAAPRFGLQGVDLTAKG